MGGSAAHGPRTRVVTAGNTRPARTAAGVAGVLISLAAAAAVAVAPVLTVAATLGAVGVALAVSHQLAAVAILNASFFFDNYLQGQGFLTPAKAVGLLALVAWVLNWGVSQLRVSTSAPLVAVAGLAVWIPVSVTAAELLDPAVVVASRYLMFFTLFFLVLQAVDGDRRRAELLVDAGVAAAGLAALLGLVSFFTSAPGRASGPLKDPNDFGFLLATVVPLALVRLQGAVNRTTRGVSLVALPLMLAAVLTTFSRSALVGLAVAGAWALGTGRARLRWGVLAVAGLVVIGAVSYAVQPEKIESSFAQKEYIGQANVESRLRFWGVALEMWQTSPLLGVGPGNYQGRFTEFQPFFETLGSPVAHNAYFSVLAELGLVGLVLFVVFLALSWRHLRRRFPDDPATDRLQSALAAGFLVAVVGCLFLDEQFYAPLWSLSALGASLAIGGREQRQDELAR